MALLRIILFPFSLLYGLVIWLKNGLYQSGVLNRTSFDFPIVCVGNLSAGGTGKTPHIEWLIRELSPAYRLAVLSRGYMRRTSGYVFAGAGANAAMIGDEPFQVKRKFPQVAVGVSENRVLGVPDLLADAPDTEVILMDDGFQHLAIRAGFNILLTPYHDLFTKDWLLPSGRLREFRSGYKRADAIIVTKCPELLSASEQQQIISGIAPLPHQLVLFSFTRYSATLKQVFDGSELLFDHPAAILAFSGIADAAVFETYLRARTGELSSIRYGDHHHYTGKDLQDLAQRFHMLSPGNNLIITTEKDAVKLADHPQRELLSALPVYYLCMEVEFMNNNGIQLINQVKQYVAQTDQ